MKALLEPRLNTEIGINVIRAHQIDEATLIAVHDDYFTVTTKKDENHYHIPFINIVKILENPGGVTVSGFFKQHRTFALVIKVGHVVEYVPS